MAIVLTHVAGGQTGRKEVLTKERISLGRALDNDVIFTSQDLRASAHHAEITVQGVEVVLKDLESTNGTYVNGSRVDRTRLRNGNIIELGKKGPKLLFEMKPLEEAMALMHTPFSKGTTLPPTYKLPDERTDESKDAPREKFGTNTVQMIVQSAVSQSASRWRSLVLASVVVAVILTTVFVYLALYRLDGEKPARSTNTSESFAEIARRNQAAVVLIQVGFEVLDEKGRLVSTDTSEGTGFVIDTQGSIVSNYHTIAPWEYDDSFNPASGKPRSKWVKVIFADHRTNDGVEAQIHRKSKELDLAILKIKPPPNMPVVEGRQPTLSQIQQGEEAAFIGFPYGTALLVTTQQEAATTTLRRTTVSKVTESLIQLDAGIQEGFSGSPVFNLQGKVIGVLAGEIGGQQAGSDSGAIGLAIPIKFVEEMLK
jgi:S1-C subfamily serine protease